MKKNLKRVLTAMFAVLMIVLVTSCSGDINKGNREYGKANWYTFKTNQKNFDYPREPNFSNMSSSELSRFQTDMRNDPEGAGSNATIIDGDFVYTEGSMMMTQDKKGEWWGSVPVDGEYLVFHYTNEWPSNGYASLLPGKPNMKFCGESIIELNPSLHKWMAMFIATPGTNPTAVINNYIGRLQNAGWLYFEESPVEGFYNFDTNENRVEITFAKVGPFYYVYVVDFGI